MQKKIPKILGKFDLGVCTKSFGFGLPDVSVSVTTSLILRANEGLRKVLEFSFEFSRFYTIKEFKFFKKFVLSVHLIYTIFP